MSLMCVSTLFQFLFPVHFASSFCSSFFNPPKITFNFATSGIRSDFLSIGKTLARPFCPVFLVRKLPLPTLHSTSNRVLLLQFVCFHVMMSVVACLNQDELLYHVVLILNTLPTLMWGVSILVPLFMVRSTHAPPSFYHLFSS